MDTEVSSTACRLIDILEEACHIFVRFGNVELSHDEILSMAEQEHNSPNI